MRQKKNCTTTPTTDNENLLIADLENLLTELTEEEMQACWGGIGLVPEVEYNLKGLSTGSGGGNHHGQRAGGNSAGGVGQFDSVTKS